jgi:hypothetical protein
VQRPVFHPDHLEVTPYHPHIFFVNLVAVARGNEFEAVVRAATRQHLAFTGFLELASPGALADLRALVLAELVEDAVGEFTLRAIVSPVVEGADLRPVLLELLAQQVVIGRLAGEAVPV